MVKRNRIHMIMFSQVIDKSSYNNLKIFPQTVCLTVGLLSYLFGLVSSCEIILSMLKTFKGWFLQARGSEFKSSFEA